MSIQLETFLAIVMHHWATTIRSTKPMVHRMIPTGSVRTPCVRLTCLTDSLTDYLIHVILIKFVWCRKTQPAEYNC